MHSVVVIATAHVSSWSQAGTLPLCLHDTRVSDKRAQEITGKVGKEKSKRWEKQVLQQLNATSSKRISLKPRNLLSLVSMAVFEGQAAVQAPTEDPKIEEQSGPTVRVRFELQRECNFGQHFAVVGNTPEFGEWNPDAAIALNWSEGHVWTSDVDVLEGTKIEFKFIQIGQDGVIDWQPGANLLLVTSSSSQAITVAEPWHAAELATLEAGPTEYEESGLKVSSLGEAIADVAVTATIALLNAGTKIATSVSGDTELELESTITPTNGFSIPSDVGMDEELVRVFEVPVHGDNDLFAQIPLSGLSREEDVSALDNELAEDLNKGEGNSIIPRIPAIDVNATPKPDLVKRNSPSLRTREEKDEVPGNLELTRGTFQEEDVVDSRIVSAEEVTEEEELIVSAKQNRAAHIAPFVDTTIEDDLPTVQTSKPRVTESIFSQTANEKVDDPSDDNYNDVPNKLSKEDTAIKGSKKPFYVHNSEVVSEPSRDVAMGGHNRDEHVSRNRNTLDGDSTLKDEFLKAPEIPTIASTLSSDAVEEVREVAKQAEQPPETTTTS